MSSLLFHLIVHVTFSALPNCMVRESICTLLHQFENELSADVKALYLCKTALFTFKTSIRMLNVAAGAKATWRKQRLAGSRVGGGALGFLSCTDSSFRSLR